MAIAAGLHQVLDPSSDPTQDFIVSRPVQPMGKDLGYLPGTLTEKMMPWVAPIQDNLECLGNDRRTLDDYMGRGTIEIDSPT